MNRDSYIYTPDPHYLGSYSGYTRDKITLIGYDFERRINALRLKLSEKKPDVFVSHKSDDKDIAQEVASTIAKCGLTAYLDIWDHNVNGDRPELVDYINAVIGCCKSLIVVVSNNTVSSWWVPLEIGIAITKDLYLGTFLVSASYKTKQNFPSYLWKWPVLQSMIAVKNWYTEHQITATTRQFYESLERKHPSMFGG